MTPVPAYPFSGPPAGDAFTTDALPVEDGAGTLLMELTEVTQD